MGRMACTESQCLYKSALYLYLLKVTGSSTAFNTMGPNLVAVITYDVLEITFSHGRSGRNEPTTAPSGGVDIFHYIVSCVDI
jgi:hypothetical protein